LNALVLKDVDEEVSFSTLCRSRNEYSCWVLKAEHRFIAQN
jgi:hypothetical protein